MPPKPNAYALFMKEQGRNNPQFRGKTMGQLQLLCGPLWNDLSAEEKAKYKDLAKDMRSNRDFLGGMDARGRIMAEVRQAEAEAKALEEKERKQVADTIRRLAGDEDGSLQYARFLLMDVTLFYEDSAQNAVLPAELSVVEFSLDEGPLECFQEFLHPGDIPFTYSRAEMISRAERTHKIQLDSPVLQKNYAVVVEILQEILMKDGLAFGRGVVFAMPDAKGKLANSLRWLYKKAGFDCELPTILDTRHLLHDLVQELAPSQHLADVVCPSINMAQALLEAESWSYEKGMICGHHSKLDVSTSNCSLGRIRRLAFIICSNCCEVLQITKEPGRHVPGMVSELVDDTFGNDVTLLSESLESSASFEGGQRKPRNAILGNRSN